MPPQQWTTLRNYSGYDHVLTASPCFVHPVNGNIYYWACEKVDDHGLQNLVIYREMGVTLEWQTVVTFHGTVDSESSIAPGGCVIGQGGALVVATSLVPIGVEHVTETGFQGVRCRISGIDDPWSMADLLAQIEALTRRVTALESAQLNQNSDL